LTTLIQKYFSQDKAEVIRLADRDWCKVIFQYYVSEQELREKGPQHLLDLISDNLQSTPWFAKYKERQEIEKKELRDEVRGWKRQSEISEEKIQKLKPYKANFNLNYLMAHGKKCDV